MKSGQYLARNTDYTDDQALLANTPTQAESLLHSLEKAPGGIGLNTNPDKTEYMSFKQKRAISTQSDKPLKLVDQFTYLGSNISSTESDVNRCLAKASNALNRLSMVWKSNLSDKT